MAALFSMRRYTGSCYCVLSLRLKWDAASISVEHSNETFKEASLSGCL